jgi:hypothetical protein
MAFLVVLGFANVDHDEIGAFFEIARKFHRASSERHFVSEKAAGFLGSFLFNLAVITMSFPDVWAFYICTNLARSRSATKRSKTLNFLCIEPSRV